MENTFRAENIPSSEKSSRPIHYYYLDSRTRKSVEHILSNYPGRILKDNLWEQLCAVLPLDRSQPVSMSLRVEGLVFAGEKLWTSAVEAGRRAFGQTFDRSALRQATGILPISHYHYLVGSREPWRQVLTRRDALHDPQTALLKLRRDVESLMEFINNLPKEAAVL